MLKKEGGVSGGGCGEGGLEGAARAPRKAVGGGHTQDANLCVRPPLRQWTSVERGPRGVVAGGGGREEQEGWKKKAGHFMTLETAAAAAAAGAAAAGRHPRWRQIIAAAAMQLEWS